ncbi:MAG: glycosyltransferase family 2 protein [Promethearchaeota archaeon]
MSKILLSFCIPTYNRPERISNLIKQFISSQSQEIEIIIGDDNPFSDKTQDVVKRLDDPRIKYFRNKKNLGMDGNMLRTIHKASGEFVFIMMDDDDIEMKSVPWLLEIIKKNKNLTRIYGTFADKRQNKKKIIITYGDKLLKRGTESLIELLFYQSHGSGVILRKRALDFKKLIKYNGCLYIQAALEAQAMIAGDTLCTSKILAHMGKIEYKSDQPLFKGKKYWHPVSRLLLWKFRIQIIYEATKGLKQGKKIRKILLNREIPRILHFIKHLYYIKDFFNAFSIIFTMKVSKSPGFWIYLILNTFFNYINRKGRKKFRILELYNKFYLLDYY